MYLCLICKAAYLCTMKQLLLLTLFLFFTGLKLSAQQTGNKLIIKGLVVDSATNKPLDFTTVVLTDIKTSQPIKSMLTKEDGAFEFVAPADKKYNISLVYIGYQPKIIQVPGGKLSVDLGNINMSSLPGQLKEVSITGTKPLLKQEIDRISFDPQADPESKANDALEMLRKVPMITVDANDQIQLKGSTHYQIFINGKPSALMANNPSEVLKSMPAATIKRVEVITVPPSKYDGEGLAGIINIITLEKSDEGINGNFFARYNNRMGERGSISIAAREGKFNINTFLGLGYQKLNITQGGSKLTTFSPATTLLQQGTDVNKANLNNGRAQLSYEADSLNLITATVDFFNRGYTQNTFRYSQFFILPDSLKQAYQLNNIGESSVGAFDLGANYQMAFKQNKDELLTLSYQYSYNSKNQDNNITATNRFNYNGNDYDQQNNTGSKEQTFQLDFLKPVKTLTIEAGAKAILRNNNSDFEEENFDQSSGQYLPDTALTDHFKYHQNVYSIYNSYQLKLKSWIFKAGLRAECTVISGDFTANSATIDQHYLNFTPAISIQRNTQKSGSFTLGFTERIERPSIAQLNPFVDRSNPEFIVTGNPNLRPVVNHLFELGYSKFGKVSVNGSINYSVSTNNIQNVTSLVNDTLSKTTYLNAGKNQSTGVSLSTNYPITDKMNFNVNAQLSHIWITGTYNSQLYKNQGNQGSLNANLGYKFNNGLNTGINVDYYSDNILLQGRTSDFIYTSIVVIKDFLKKKVTVSLTVNNPFKELNNYSTFTKTADFQQSSYSQEYYRNFRLAFNYKFGKMKGEIKTNKRGIKNDDVKDNGSNGEKN